MSESSEQFWADLEKEIHGDVFSDILHRAAYSSDASIYRIIPRAVIVPRDVEDIVTVVRLAGENNIPIAARGAGSGVAGESLCSGIVLDCRQYFKRTISSEDEGGYVVCEPGVVLDDLNAYLADYGRKIGTEPSTSNRACMGGCVANNSTGAHSLQYGYMSDFVESVEAVLADGSVAELVNGYKPKSDEALDTIAKNCISLLSGKDKAIEKALPRAKRNRGGYNIAGICKNRKIDLAKLMAGSEGTLAIFTKIKLRTVELPKAKGLLQLEFDSLEKMAQAVPAIVDSGASACELMDDRLIGLAVNAYPRYEDILPTGARAVLLVEQTGESNSEVKEKIERTASAVKSVVSNTRKILDEQMQRIVWKSRKDAVPLLERAEGTKQAVPFIEDVSVENSRLAEYMTGLEKIAKKFRFQMSFYGHAGDGELHIRPYLDLGDNGDVQKMVAAADEVFSLAWSLGGSVSGEHAVGLVRAAFLRSQYGDEFYELMCKIKNVFDAGNIMNPGKIINSDPDIMIKNLRAQRKIQKERLRQNQLKFEENEMEKMLSVCSGCGLCLSREEDFRMCPVFRATGEELASTRAKANVINMWMQGEISDKDFESGEFRDFFDLCVNCRLCSVECPAGFDASKLMMNSRAQYVRRKGLRKEQFILSKNRYLSIINSTFGGIANFMFRIPLLKKIIERIFGIDRRRQMPKFEFSSFRKKAGRFLQQQQKLQEPIEKAAFFTDTFVNYNDHELGFAVLNVLRDNNIEVVLPAQRPVPLPAACYGDIKTAKKDLEYNVEHLAKAVKAGYKIVCSEPSAALFLKNELRHFVSGEDAKLVSDNTFELMSFLLDLFNKGLLKPCEKKLSGEYVYHTPCHLFAFGETGASIELLDKLCGLEVRDLKAGCCGLAGTFGMQKDKYELSDKISESLKRALVQTSAEIVLTECAACGMQIEHISTKKSIHPIKLLAQCYGK